jgi:exopolysaccharide production protein ExoQ
MPIITLTLSLLFSAFLIVRDCRRRRDVSLAIWVPTIFFAVLASRPASLWLTGHQAQLGIENANSQSGSAADQLFFLFGLAVSLAIATARGMKWGKLFSANTAIMLFYLYFAISICWSSDPTGSVKRLVKDFGILFVAGVIFTEKDPLKALRAVYVRCAFLLLPLSIVFIKYFPSFGRSYGIGGEVMLTGVTTQKNSLGEIVLIFTLFLIWDYVESRPPGQRWRLKKLPWDLVILLLLGLQLLRLSQSKSGLICTLVGSFLLLRSGALLSKSISWAALWGAISLPFLLLFSQGFPEVVAPLLAAMGRDATFTGRTNIWKHITIDTVNPLIGAGYWNFWGGPGGLRVNEAMNEVIPNAHNGYVDLYLDGGIIGLAILLIMLVACGGRVIKNLRARRDPDRYLRIRLAFVVVLIIYNLSESTFARMGPIWFTALLMMTEFPAMARARKVKAAVLRKDNLLLAERPPVFVNPEIEEMPVSHTPSFIRGTK